MMMPFGSAAMTPAVEVSRATKVFGSGDTAQTVLHEVSLYVARGEFVFLAGPSGSGKTTLLSIIGCALRPTSGSVRLYGTEVTATRDQDLPAIRASHIGFIFQGHNLIASMSALENIVFQMQIRGFSRREAEAEAEELLTRVGLGEKRHALPSDLSGGQRQRVAVARAVAGRPPLILADEPTASLDHESGMLVTELLRDLASERGHSVIVVTHDSRIFHLADRIEHLEDGRFIRAEEASIPSIRITQFIGS